jgi:hypothetical protein
MFIRTITKPNGKSYCYVMASFRSKGRLHPVNKIVSDLTGLPREVVEIVKAMLEGARVTVARAVPGVVRVMSSMSFGPLWIAMHFWLKLNPRGLTFLNAREFTSLTAMVIARCVDPVFCRSELRTAEWLGKTAMHLILGGSPRQWDRDDFYPVLTKLSMNWRRVEDHLWKDRTEAPRLYLYDITSSYFEGSGGSLGALGHSRDEKRSNPQIVIALVADQDGVPVAVRILAGNTKDSVTVAATMSDLKTRFGVQKAVAIMDRGMRSEANVEAIVKEGLDYVMALPHKKARQFVIERGESVEWELFDERGLAEWADGGKRYVLCRNPATAVRDRSTMDKIYARAEGRLDKLANMVAKGRIKDRDKILVRAVRILAQTKAEKYFDYEFGDGKFVYRRTEQVERADVYAGCYVLETTLPETVDKKEIDSAYRNQREVEEVFKSCKDELHLRPNFHKKDENIWGHVYLTFLAHYVKKTLERQLRKAGCNERGSTFLSKFSNIEVNDIEIGGVGQNVVTELDGEQIERAAWAGVRFPSGQVSGSLQKHLRC